jgi:chitin disaccharide deacetylase
LPVLDDLVTEPTTATEYSERKAQLKTLLQEMKPGIMQIIVHCSDAGAHFNNISASGPKRLAEMMLMMDDDIKELIKKEGIILTTWRELKQRRDKVSSELSCPTTNLPSDQATKTSLNGQ